MSSCDVTYSIQTVLSEPTVLYFINSVTDAYNSFITLKVVDTSQRNLFKASKVLLIFYSRAVHSKCRIIGLLILPPLRIMGGSLE